MRSSLSCALYPVSGFRYPVSGLAFSLSLPTKHYAAPYTPYRRSRAEYHREDLFRDSADLSSDAWRPSACHRRSHRPASAHTCVPAQSPALKLRKRPVGSCCVTKSITRRRCPLRRKRESRRPNSSCQGGQIFSKLCAYENYNSPIKKFNEPLAFARVPSHPARARLLCAFAASAGRLSRRLLSERQHCPR